MNFYDTLLRLHRFQAILVFTVCVFVSVMTHAHNTVAVIPLAGDDLKPLTNIITVAKENGDYSNPLAALAAITDASAEKPYLIVIAPGQYDITPQLVMKPFVDIAGSGRRATRLGASAGGNSLDSSSAPIVGADNSHLQDLGIFNSDRASDFAVGIFNSGASPTISNVHILVAGGLARYGVANTASSSPTISNVEIEQYVSSIQIGINNDNNSNATIRDTRIEQSGSGDLLAGIVNGVNGTSIVDSCHIKTSGKATNKFGVLNFGSNSSAKIRNSTLSAGVSASIGTDNFETYISNTILGGPITGNPVCSFSYLDDGTELNSACVSL